MKIKTTSRITNIEVDEDAKKKVKIAFLEITPKGDEEAADLAVAETNGVENEAMKEQDLVTTNEYNVKAEHMPHSDFLKAMAKLTKYGMEICEIDDTVNTSNYRVLSFSISGDMSQKKSRVVLTMTKFVERTTKTIKFRTPQIAMYGKSDYDKAPALTKAIEECIDEARSYIIGKYAEKNGQLPLFERHLKVA